MKPKAEFIKPDSEYSLVNDTSHITGKGYELFINSAGDIWYLLDGKNHRENAPAVIHTNGYQAWHINNKYHNLNGPAVIWEDGGKDYHIDGKYYKENEFWIIKKKCFKCQQKFNNLYDLKIHLEQYDDAKNMINYIFKLLIA